MDKHAKTRERIQVGMAKLKDGAFKLSLLSNDLIIDSEHTLPEGNALAGTLRPIQAILNATSLLIGREELRLEKLEVLKKQYPDTNEFPPILYKKPGPRS